jgi:hypothetical protein
MANGDPCSSASPNRPITVPSGTLLVHNGSPFGTQITAFWVQRYGSPICSAVIRGDNFSTPITLGVTPAGILAWSLPNPRTVCWAPPASGQNLFLAKPVSWA